MHRALVAAALVAVAAPLGAQGPAAQAAKPAAAPAAPAGWAVRFDKASADPAKASFTTMGKGMHFTTGPSGTWYKKDEMLDGEYSVEATFVQTKAPMHPEAYGLVVMANDMETPKQSYVYFVVRGTGEWLMKHRASDTEVHTINDWTAHPAVAKQDAAGKAKNTLKVDVKPDSVRFMINGQNVKAFPRSYMKDVKGLAGIRMNHGLDVHVDGWAATTKKAAAN